MKWIECNGNTSIDNGFYAFRLYNSETKTASIKVEKITGYKVGYHFATHYCKIVLPELKIKEQA